MKTGRALRAILERIHAAQVADVRPSRLRVLALRALWLGVAAIERVSRVRPVYLVAGALALPLLIGLPMWQLASWRPRLVSQVAFPLGARGWMTGAKLSSDGRVLVSAQRDTLQDNVWAWGIAHSQMLCFATLPARLEPGSTSYALSPDGREIVVFWQAGSRIAGQILSLRGKKPRRIFAVPGTSPDDFPCDARFSPDETQLWLATSQTIVRFDARSGRFLRRDSLALPDDVNQLSTTRFVSNAPMVLRDNWGFSTLWDISQKPRIVRPRTDQSVPVPSPDGKRIAPIPNTSPSAKKFFLWSRDGREIYAPQGKTLLVLSPEGQVQRQLPLSVQCAGLFLAPSNSDIWILSVNGDLIAQRVR